MGHPSNTLMLGGKLQANTQLYIMYYVGSRVILYTHTFVSEKASHLVPRAMGLHGNPAQG